MAADFAMGGCCILDEMISKGEEKFEGKCISADVAAAIKAGREAKGSHSEVAKGFGLACCKFTSDLSLPPMQPLQHSLRLSKEACMA